MQEQILWLSSPTLARPGVADPATAAAAVAMATAAVLWRCPGGSATTAVWRAGITPRFSKAGCEQGCLFVIDQQPIPVLDSPSSLCMVARMAQSPLLWHYRFAHSSCRRLADMVVALDGSMYYVSLSYDYSKLLAVMLIKQKSDAAVAIIDMVRALERQSSSKLKALRRGGQERLRGELQWRNDADFDLFVVHVQSYP
ncbi:hypothetical protein QJQ45_004869 [Haematococcus lacustris]|nr:hypothetical protein QJQ45_004869 [Haematococcus lacustris]